LNHGVLVTEKSIPPLDFNEWITEDYLELAYKDIGKDYKAEKSIMNDPIVTNNGLPMEIWHSREGILTYPSMSNFLTAVSGFRATGAKLNSTYVYDKETGLKLFGKTAFFVKADGGFTTFLRKPDADSFASKSGGAVMDLEGALASL
jgi:NitT/TauT family transport system substrate-binding protein